MKTRMIVAILALALAAGAAQGLEIEPELELAALPPVGSGAGQTAYPLFDAMAGITGRHLFDDGIRTGARLRVRFIRNIGSRPGFAGRFGSDLPQFVAPPPGTTWPKAPISPVTGLSPWGKQLDIGSRIVPELARLWLDGRWGEVSVGMDQGPAHFLDARPRRLFAAADLASGTLDPTGFDIVRSANDISGTAAKISYISPRILGFRGGLAWTPGSGYGVLRHHEAATETHAAADIGNMVEMAISFSRRWRASGLRTRLGLTWSLGEDYSLAYERFHAVGLGVELEKKGWHYGLRWLYSNNGRSEGGTYHAVETGLSYKSGKWQLGAEFGWAMDDLLDMTGMQYAIGAAIELEWGMSLAFGFVSATAEIDSPYAARQSWHGAGPLMELRLKIL